MLSVEKVLNQAQQLTQKETKTKHNKVETKLKCT